MIEVKTENPVVAFIPYGEENVVTREYLSSVTGLTDRVVRRMIEVARGEGIPIVNGADGKGYYISENLKDLERYYRIERARALSILKRLSSARKILKEAGVDVRN